VDATDVIAIYAALVATGSLGWQIARERRQERTRLEVEVRLGFLAFDSGAREAILINISNRSSHPVKVTSAGLLHQSRPKARIAITNSLPPAGLPVVIAAKDAHQTWIEKTDLPPGEVDLFKPLQAYAGASTGEEFHSRKTTLLVR
jgi:hypothetical protein